MAKTMERQSSLKARPVADAGRAGCIGTDQNAWLAIQRVLTRRTVVACIIQGSTGGAHSALHHHKKAPSRRVEFVQDACAGDSGLLQRVDALLAAHECTTRTSPQRSHAERPGVIMDRYKILERSVRAGWPSCAWPSSATLFFARSATMNPTCGDTRSELVLAEPERQGP